MKVCGRAALPPSPGIGFGAVFVGSQTGYGRLSVPFTDPLVWWSDAVGVVLFSTDGGVLL